MGSQGKSTLPSIWVLTVVAHFIFVSTCVTKSSDTCHLLKGPNYALRQGDFTHVSTSWQAEQGWKTYQLPKGPATYKTTVPLLHHVGPQIPKEEEKKAEKYHVGAACLHVFWATLNTHLESHQSSKASKNIFLITNQCTIVVGLFKMAQEGLCRGGVLCLLAQVRGVGGAFFLPCDDFLLERHFTARDRSQGGGRFVGKQNWS